MTDDQEDTGSMAYMPKVHALLAERGITFTNSFFLYTRKKLVIKLSLMKISKRE